MNAKISKTILAGIAGTVVMTIVTMLAPMMGMPKMSPPEMVSGMMGLPIAAGWMMHFMIGIIFAFAYTYALFSILKIQNILAKGAVFGIIAFIFAQIMMVIMGSMMQMPEMEGAKMMMMVGSLIGHIIFGMVVSKIVGES